MCIDTQIGMQSLKNEIAKEHFFAKTASRLYKRLSNPRQAYSQHYYCLLTLEDNNSAPQSYGFVSLRSCKCMCSLKYNLERAKVIAQFVKCLVYKPRPEFGSPYPHKKPGMVACASNPSSGF